MNNGDFTGRKVLVTGGARGIGAAIVRAFAAAGARVAVHYVTNAAAAERTCVEVPGDSHVPLQADLADPSATAHLIDRTYAALGGLDILVNNAGLYRTRPLLEHDPQSWQRDWNDMLAVNLAAPAQLCYLAARQMLAAGVHGRIVNISSRGAYRGEPEAPAYGAAKAGLNALTQSLAVALAPHGISVSAVAPGWVETDMSAPYLAGAGGRHRLADVPVGRAARPQEVAAAVLYLASDAANYATGAILDFNGASYLR